MTGARVGEGRSAEVFNRGDHVVKLYRAGVLEAVVQREATALQVAERLEVVAPRDLGVVREGDRWGLAMTRLPGPSLGALLVANPDQLDAGLQAMARLQTHLHRLPGGGLPSQADRLRDRIERVLDLPTDLRGRLLGRLSDLPTDHRLCHGDFHPFNLVVADPAEVPLKLGILDWLDATSGPPAADACRTLILLTEWDEDVAAKWLAAFSAESGLVPSEILSWRPVLAAARLAEGFTGPEAARLRAWADEA